MWTTIQVTGGLQFRDSNHHTAQHTAAKTGKPVPYPAWPTMTALEDKGSDAELDVGSDGAPFRATLVRA